MSHTKKLKILIVDDDESLCDLLSQYLKKHDYIVDYVGDGIELDQYLKKTEPDLIILDQMLPGEDGLSIATRLQQSHFIPIIMLSACGEEIDRILGLEMGADDYLAKPFNPRELLARIKSVLRRYKQPLPPTHTTNTPLLYKFGDITVDTLSHTLIRNGVTVPLTQSEFSLLELFLENPNRILSRDTLQETLKGFKCSPYDRSIDVRISRLRQKLETDPANPEYIQTVWGLGYKFLLKN